MQRRFSNQRVDRSTYDRQRDRLRHELALLEMQEHDAKLARLDVERLLEFALLVLRDASLERGWR